MCEVIRVEMCEGRNVQLDLRGAKRVRGKMCEYHENGLYLKLLKYSKQ